MQSCNREITEWLKSGTVYRTVTIRFVVQLSVECAQLPHGLQNVLQRAVIEKARINHL